LVGSLLCALAGACGDDDDDVTMPDAGDAPARDGGREPDKRDSGTYQPDRKDAGGKDDDHGSHTKRDSGTPKPSEPDASAPSFSGLVVDTAADEQDLDLFGQPGHRFWLEVNDEQLERLNEGGGYYGGGGQGDIYVPPVSGSFADHVIVQDAKTGSVADYGKMEIKLVGESTFRNWNSSAIPNVHIDTDEFQKKARIGGFEHFRLNNSIVGTIFREQIAHHVFRALGYPALRASYAFLGSNVWGDGVWVPMTLIEMYKLRFCDDNEELLGGTCENMWEFPGDVGQGGYPGGFPGEFGGGPIFIDEAKAGAKEPAPQFPPEWCQVKDCDDTRLGELAEKLAKTPLGPGWGDALAEYIDWNHFHQFQCIDWMLWVGDDPLHNSNNNLIIERDDGKMIWAPYSVDISAGQDWYLSTPLTGSNSIALGCQSDPACWADTIAACEKLIAKFDELNPEKFVDATQKTLTKLDMMRSGDVQRARDLRAWYVQRQEELPGELERYRYLPDVHGDCPDGLEQCSISGGPYGGGQTVCGTPEQCQAWICPVRSQWCETYASCISADEECVTCEGDTPVYCALSESCVATQAECDALCGGDSYEFCPAYGECVPAGYCQDGDIDGGVGGSGGFGGMVGLPGTGE
jgi:hypothetical protein